MQTRVRRPYEKKIIRRSGALIFGLGLGSLLAVIALAVAFAMPTLSPHLDNMMYRARTYYRKLMPHPEYLPTPAPTAMAAAPTLLPVAEQGQLYPTPTPTQTPPATVSPTPGAVTVTPVPPTATSAVVLQSIGPAIQLSGLTHQWQTWNNCGPATITMNTSYFGHTETQADAALFLKPNRDDKNVSPEELAAYARTTGLQAIVRAGGTVEQLKQFLSNNLPVLVETWLVHDGDGLGHYRLLTGYDDAGEQFNTVDSLNGPDFKVNYAQFDSDWRVFNRVYIVVYPPEQAEAVAAIIGLDMTEAAMYERIAAAEAAQPADAIAFFNQGDALTRLGRFQEAAAAFDQARQLKLHWRRLWYQFTPFEAYYAAGRYQDVLDLTEATIKSAGGLEEAYYYKGLALQATGQPGAEQEFQAALDYNPNFAPAAQALNQ
jgi:tetratricopeptide (TPR) repeat protein